MLSSTWARLVGGISPSATPTKRTDQRTGQPVARFARVHKQLLQSCRRLSGDQADAQLADHVRGLLDQLTSMLRDEVRTPVPHPCFSYAISQGLADTAVEATQTVHDEAVVRAATYTFSALINGADDLLGDEGFAKSLMSLTDTISRPQSVDCSSDTVAAVVELRFEVAAKMRLQPDILPAWFIPARARRRSSEEARPSSLEPNGLDRPSSDKDDFPLFYSLIDHVHYESPIGDFARTGLLYIIEAASSNAELERWVIESDLATLMASGLGALYSQLSRKLVVTFSTPELPPILALSDYATPSPAHDAQASASPEYAVHLSTLLSDLMFWQDVLDHCPSAEIKRTLLDHFEILFLKQVLYPSLIESSDDDGGSSVAALTYLHRMLESLRNPELVKVTLEYLLAVPEPVQPERPRTHRSPSVLKRRKTLDSVSKLPNADAYASPKLFSLVDLINASLRSPNQQAVAATLKVASVLLRCHHFYALSTLVQCFSTADHKRRTIGGHEEEIDNLLLLAASIGDVDDGDESYQGYGQDALSSIENHPCSESSFFKERPALAESPPAQRAAPGNLRKPFIHSILPEDSFLKNLVRLLRVFFGNTVEVNLGLTDAIVAIASCSFTNLEGWLLVDPVRYQCDDEEIERKNGLHAVGPRDESSRDFLDHQEAKRIAAMRRVQQRPSWPATATPPLMATLWNLVDDIRRYRSDVPHFDAHLAQRRLLLHPLSESKEETTASPPVVETASYQSQSPGLGAAEDVLRRKITIRPVSMTLSDKSQGSMTQSSGSVEPDAVPAAQLGDPAPTTVTVNHLLTNAIILQDFILELVAIIQISPHYKDMARHEWTRFEINTLICLLVRRPIEAYDDPMALPTALNQALHRGDHASDIDHREIRRKAKEILRVRPEFVELMQRHRVPKMTRTLMRAFERGLRTARDRSPSRARGGPANESGGQGDAGDVGDGWGGDGDIDDSADSGSNHGTQRGSSGRRRGVFTDRLDSAASYVNKNNDDDEDIMDATAKAAALEGWGEADADDEGAVNETDQAQSNGQPNDVAGSSNGLVDEALLEGWGEQDAD